MGFETLWVKVKADLSDFNAKMSKLQNQMTDVGQRLKSAGQQMTLGLTAPVVAFGTYTLKAAGDFEAGMNKVQALTGATGTQLKELRDLAKQLGRDTQFSAGQAADAMGFLAMAGMEANQIMGAMPDTLNLAAAAGIDLASSADIVTNILTGMQVPMEQLPQAVDVLTKAFTSANTDLTQLGQAMKFVGPVAGSFGISIEETTAALGLLGNAGLQASIAGTGFRRILTTLVAKQDELGVAVYDSSGRMRNFADILADLEKQGFSSEQAMAIFGDRAGPAMITLLSAGSKKLKEFTGTLENAGGTAKTIAETQMKGLNGAIKELKSAFEAFQIALADSGLLDWVTGMAKKVAEFFRNLTEANPAIMRMATVFAAVAAVAGPLALTVGALATAAGALTAPILAIVAGGGALAGVLAAIAVKGSSASAAIARQRDEVNMLVGKLKMSNLSEEERVKILERLKSIAPEVHATISKEGEVTARTNAALQNYNRSLARKIVLQQKQEELGKLAQAEADAQMQAMQLEADLLEKLNRLRETGTTAQKNIIEQGLAAGMSYKEIAKAIAAQVDMQDIANRQVHNATTANENLILALNGTASQLQGAEQRYREAALAVDEYISKNEELAAKIGGENTAGLPPVEEVQQRAEAVKAALQTISAEVGKASGEMTFAADAGKQAIDSMIQTLPQRFAETMDMFNQNMQNLKDRIRDNAMQAASHVQGFVDNVIFAFQGAILGGKSFSNVMGNILTGVMRAFGNFLIKFGRASIAYLTMVKAVKNAWANPVVGIGAAIAAIAAGIALKAMANSIQSSMALADGGLVHGPTMALVGDNPNARTDPEVVAPLSKLKGMIGGGRQELFAVVRGEDIYLVNEEYKRKIGLIQ